MKLPGVGLAVIIMDEDKVLLGERKNAHGAGTYAFPGGHLEMFEDFSECAIREVKEKTGLVPNFIDTKPSAITNDFFPREKKHYVTLFMRMQHSPGLEPQNLEPNKCEGWDWYKWEKLPNNLMVPINNLIKQGYNPFKI